MSDREKKRYALLLAMATRSANSAARLEIALKTALIQRGGLSAETVNDSIEKAKAADLEPLVVLLASQRTPL